MSGFAPGSEADTCPGAYTPSPYGPTWDPLASEWSDTCLLRDTPFTAELNIGGKFVYGYNWRLKREVMCPGWSKAGWWRLTFYAPTVLFDDAAVPLAPPTLPPAGPGVAVEPTGTLYRPVVDAANTSGLVPGGGLVAIYSYQNQSQGVAYSTDNGRTWTKYVGNPVIPALEKDFRDPKVI